MVRTMGIASSKAIAAKQREAAMKCTALPDAAFHPQASTLPLYDCLRDMQANTQTGVGARLRVIHLIEPLEYALLMLWVDADAVVAHSHLGPFAIALQRHENRVRGR